MLSEVSIYKVCRGLDRWWERWNGDTGNRRCIAGPADVVTMIHLRVGKRRVALYQGYQRSYDQGQCDRMDQCSTDGLRRPILPDDGWLGWFCGHCQVPAAPRNLQSLSTPQCCIRRARRTAVVPARWECDSQRGRRYRATLALGAASAPAAVFVCGVVVGAVGLVRLAFLLLGFS